jgi:stage II sporulation protein D
VRTLVAGISRAPGLLVLILVWFPVLAQNGGVEKSNDADVRISVLGLFHPHQFTVSAPAGSALVLHAGAERIALENSSGVYAASVRISDTGAVVAVGKRVVRAPMLTVTGRNDEPANFVLAVPDKIVRHYHGTLESRPAAGILLAIVTIDRETAVASVVAAESLPGTPPEALQALAVAARSYFVAGRGRHHNFDFCDTTHCQFLREPPTPGTPAARAVALTRGLVLAYDSRPIAAMYTPSCSGYTNTPARLGLPSAAYPYYPVECKYCRAHPVRWSSRISTQEAANLHTSNETERLKLVRRLGWDVVPSNSFVIKAESDQIILEGTGTGHGIGLCQAGARAMAEQGASFRQILSHYYPNTTIVNWPDGASIGPAHSKETGTSPVVTQQIR